MRALNQKTFVVFGFLLGCAPTTEALPPPAEPVAPPPAAPAQSVAPAPVAEPTPEEKKKAEERQQLENDWVKLREEQASETARLTPEVSARAKALAEATYPSGRAAITAALKGPHRHPGHADRDRYRHPLETLEFFGLKPTQTVLEYGPGEGWYTELLAPALAKRGKLIVTTTDPNGPKEVRTSYYGARTKLFLEKLPDVYGKVQTVTIDAKAPKLALDGSLDVVLAIRSLHGMHNGNTLGAWLQEFHRSLKPNGVLGIVQHRAAATANPDETGKKGYLPEPWVIEKVQAAGFKLAGKSEVNANPKDTKDYPEGVWALPPTLRNGEKDRDKYIAIGESDRMTLKFVKVASAAAPQASKAPAPALAPAAKAQGTSASVPAAKAPATSTPSAPAAAPGAKKPDAAPASPGASKPSP